MSILVPQAQSFWFNVEVAKADFEKYVSDHTPSILVLNEKRPRQLVGPALNYDRWVRYMAERLIQDHGEILLYAAECEVKEVGDTYNAGSLIYLMPSLKAAQPDMMLLGLEREFKKRENISPMEIALNIEERQKQCTYDPSRWTKYDDGEPIVHDELILVDLENELSMQNQRTPSSHLVKMGDKVPPEMYEALIGKTVGSDVVCMLKIRDANGQPQRMRQRIKIVSKVRVAEMADEEFYKIQGVKSQSELETKSKRSIEEWYDATFHEKFLSQVLTNVPMTDIPAAYVYDRTEGFVQAGIADMGEKEFCKSVGGKTKQAAMDAAMPAMRTKMIFEIGCWHLAKFLGINVPESKIDEELINSNMVDTFDTRYVTLLSVITEAVASYYKTGEIPKMEVSRIQSV